MNADDKDLSVFRDIKRIFPNLIRFGSFSAEMVTNSDESKSYDNGDFVPAVIMREEFLSKRFVIILLGTLGLDLSQKDELCSKLQKSGIILTN